MIIPRTSVSLLSPARFSPQGSRSRLRRQVLLFLACWSCSTPLWINGINPQPGLAFPSNSLESTQPDPLLPRPPVDRPLSPQERSVLSAALADLDRQAQAELQAGNRAQAFQIWTRELRLRRALGMTEEIEALGRVGAIAWQEAQASEVRMITRRLQTLEQQLQVAPLPANYSRLQATIAAAYRQVRARDLAANAYQILLAQARQQGAIATEAATLQTIGELYLSGFDYPNAANAYQNLLILVQAQGGTVPVATLQPSAANQPAIGQTRLTETEVLEQLAFIYQRAKQPDLAIAAQQQLITLYQQQNQQPQNPSEASSRLPAIKLAMARNYELLGQWEPAIAQYQETYRLAQSLQQFSFASAALENLGALHQSQNRLGEALEIFEFLLDVEQQAYNVYGRMNTYDRIGQIYAAQQAYPQALTAFRNGLTLAEQLNYRQEYFATQISQIQQATQSPGTN